MKTFKKSDFVAAVYSAASSLNCDARRRSNPDDAPFEKYLAFLKMEEQGLTLAAHGWREGEGYSKECPINRAVLLVAGRMRHKDSVTMEDVVVSAMVLIEYTEAAWEEYTTLLSDYEKAKDALVAA